MPAYRAPLEDVGRTPLYDLLKKDDKFVIPQFQRFFVWNEGRNDKNVEIFWNDLIESLDENSEMFFGTMLLNDTNEHIEVVDGQQRIVVTLTLLRSILENARYDSLENHRDEFANLLKNTTIKNNTGPKVEYEKNREDSLIHNFFKYRILEGDSSYEPENEVDPVENMREALDVFEEKITGENAIEEEKLERLCKFLKKRLKVVALWIRYDKYEIFESINSKGKPLSDADKIKNSLFASAENESKRNELDEEWTKLFEQFNYETSTVSTFLDRYWTSSRKNAGNIFYKRFSDWKSRRNLDPVKFTEELNQYAEIYYKALIEVNKENTRTESLKGYWGGGENAKKIIEHLKNLNYLEIEQPILLILQIRKRFSEDFDKNNNKKFVEVFQNLEKLSVLHTQIFGKYPSTLKSKIAPWSQRLYESSEPESNDKEEVLESIKEELRTEINEFLEGHTFEDRINQKSSRLKDHFGDKEKTYILYQLLKENTDSKMLTDRLWNFDPDDTIEHVMPQNRENKNWRKQIQSNFLEEWENWDDRDTEERIEKYYDTFLNDLGNLVLLLRTDNSKLQDKGFEEKREFYETHESDNGLFTYDIIQNADRWSFEEIEERREKMIDDLKDFFTTEDG